MNTKQKTPTVYCATCSKSQGRPVVWEVPQFPLHCFCDRVFRSPSDSDKFTGAGDVISFGLDKLGIKKKSGCKCPERQVTANRWFPFLSSYETDVQRVARMRDNADLLSRPTGTPWCYAVTTVPSRIESGLTQETLASLKKAGFPDPVIGVDGTSKKAAGIGKVVVQRPTHFGAFGNWLSTALELYLLDPHAERYAIFQDDFVACKHMREYLDSCELSDRVYWNLYTFPQNEHRKTGWNPAKKRGKGAVALVFANECFRQLLTSKRFLDRARQPGGTKNIDGGIVNTMTDLGVRELVHTPSLIQHTGDVSAIGNSPHPDAPSFVGEKLDARKLITVRQELSTIGLIGYNAPTGLGELNRQIAEYCNIQHWLVKPHKSLGALPVVGVPSTVCKRGVSHTYRKALADCDVVLFCETPYYSDLPQHAKQMGKRVVCVPMFEWLGSEEWVKHVDLFISPTQQCHDRIRDHLPSVLFKWPFDTNRFKFRKRTHVENFLYVGGNGGWKGRKGQAVIDQALEIWPELPLIRFNQKTNPVKSNADLYIQGDVLLCPHRLDGLGLEPMEALASGMPIVSTDGKPWNELPNLRLIDSVETSIPKSGIGEVPWHEPSAEHIVELCRNLVGKNIAKHSRSARKFAEAASWASRVAEFEKLVRGN